MDTPNGHLEALLARSLEQGVVSVDHNRGCATVNPAAAKLLALPTGEIAVSEFDAAMRDLESRVRSRSGAESIGTLLTGESEASVNCVLRFDQPPTPLRVSSHALPEGTLSDRVWLFDNLSAAAEALEAVDEARRKQARADALYRRSMDSAAVGTCLADLEGNFVEVNQALCEFFGYPAETLRHMTWQELTAPDYLEADLANRAQVLAGEIESYRMTKQFIHADGRRIWGDLSASCVRDDNGHVEVFIGQIIDITEQVEANERNRNLVEELARKNEQLAASELAYRLLVENSGDVVFRTGQDRKNIWVSPNVGPLLGAPADYWIGRLPSEVVPPEDMDAHIARWKAISEGGSFQGRVRFVSPNGPVHWCHVHIKPFYDAEGRRDGAVSAIRVIDDEVAGEQAVETARRLQSRADERFRRAMDSAAVGMCLLTPDGRLQQVNDALCRLFGYDADTLLHKSWQELTAPEDLDAGLQKVNELLEGRIDSYRMLKRFIRADGHLVWGDVSVGCVRDEDGKVENLIAQLIDITGQVEADERNRILAQQLKQQAELTKAELKSAASYMSSIMPKGLHGPVTVSSRYLPSRELGGDCFDYTWIDDDHLMVYLIDVSGHGIEPALLAVSVHNLLRSGTFSTETLLAPSAVLAELNRLFEMEKQSDHYFTMWYGIYERSTRTLLYGSAGVPPALAFSSTPGSDLTATELATNCTPVGVFADTEFTTSSYSVPHGCRVLLYSDGASELILADGAQMDFQEFKKLTTQLAGSPNWSLDDLIGELRDLTTTGVFEDDGSLILLSFD